MPIKPRRDGWNVERQRGFILRLALSGSVGASAGAVGMTKRGAYDLRAKPGATSFAAAWDFAASLGISTRADHALERAVAGEVVPVFYKGRRCGKHIRYSHGLTIAVLNMAARDSREDTLTRDQEVLILNDFLEANR